MSNTWGQVPIALSGALLASMLLLAVLHVRDKSMSAVTTAIIAGAVLVPGLGTLVQVYLLLTRTAPQPL